MNRDFKGVWIPKEIWLNPDLTWVEKLILTEINSLDNENGCFASNNYFGKFFHLSPGRISQLINSIKKKGFISCEYEKNGKETVKRVVRILNTGIKNSKGGIKKSDIGYLENDKDNNTVSNTFNNTKGPSFKKPSVEDIQEYLQEKSITSFTASGFFDFYESKGWMIGKNKMKDWKACVRTWTGKSKSKIDSLSRISINLEGVNVK